MSLHVCVWKAAALFASGENVTSLAKWAGTARQWWIWSFRGGLIFLTCWWENVLIKKQRQKEKANWSHLWHPFPSLFFIVLLVCFAACGAVKTQLIALNVLRGKNAPCPAGACGWHMENNTCSEREKTERWKQNEKREMILETNTWLNLHPGRVLDGHTVTMVNKTYWWHTSNYSTVLYEKFMSADFIYGIK